MVESTYASDSPRSRSPMTEPSSPLQDGPGISGYNQRYLYNYSPESLQHKLKIAMDSQNRSFRNHEFEVHERSFSRGGASPIGSEQARLRPRESSRPTSSANMSSPTSLFTIDSILAPRPIGNLTPTSTTNLSMMQNPEVIGSSNRTATIHPLQQQLQHLAFTPADFLGRWIQNLFISLIFVYVL